MAEETADLPLTAEIVRRMKDTERGLLRFRDYMELCLYHPRYGYYMKEREKVGRGGDFYTSAAVGGIMGEIVGRYFASMALKTPGLRCFAEWGGGTGQMARQILDAIRSMSPSLYEEISYEMIEKSAYHRIVQEQTLGEHKTKIRFVTEKEWKGSGPHRGTFVFSNELLDAFPVHRVKVIGGELHELYVAWDEEAGRFSEIALPCEDGRLIRYLQEEDVGLREGQTAEINLEAEDWIRDVAGSLESGCIVTVDYGDTAGEIYAEHRMNGTLMCYRQHIAHDDPYRAPGEEDITSHVDFSACIRAGRAAGIREWKLSPQREFLVEAGVLELLRSHAGTDPFSSEARRNRAVRQLLLGDGMGDVFKVLLQIK